VLIVVSVVLVGAAAVVFRGDAPLTRPTPLPVQEGDSEIVWLYPATNTTAWERFVAAVEKTGRRLHLDVQQRPSAQPTAVPEVTLAWQKGGRNRLVFRWYKLTRDWTAREWIRVLLKRNPPPLAIIGGGNSFWARELASQLQIISRDLEARKRPLLLLTTATADRVPFPDYPAESNGEQPDPFAALRTPQPGDDPDVAPGVDLHRLYPGRTFRFCFTNRQMATAITRFIWGRDDLRPDSDPVYMVQWKDDDYSRDLVEGFSRTLRRRFLETMLHYWMALTGTVLSGGGPPGLPGGVLPFIVTARHGAGVRMDAVNPLRIDSRVGGFLAPNPYEAEAVRDLLDQFQATAQPQRRPLLVVSGQAQPSRRLLRDLARSAPDTARRFVVVTGDAIAFNLIYRDRQITWPIQDLPFHLVFFCHRNPIDREAGFKPLSSRRGMGFEEDPSESSLALSSGTEDLLLFADLVEALSLAFRGDSITPVLNAEELGARLAEVRYRPGAPLGLASGGTALFDATGKRHNGTGEHVVYLRPQFQGDRVLPEAIIEVWGWQTSEQDGRRWTRSGEPLAVSYDEARMRGGR
jgi:hypothetical protein